MSWFHVKPMQPFFSKMFRQKTLDVITLFHKPSLSSSNRVLTLLKQGSSQAQETATVDQAGDHAPQNNAVQREPFELDVTESTPTEDQLRSIFEYVGQNKISSVVEGATSVSDAVKKLAADEGAFKRPVVVDWNQGRAVVGENEPEIQKLLRDAPNQ
ncbi:hypothetical protein LTR70_005912 [Exophiala xenobiotica]|uniref:DUF1687-domain-containing protein n=1 Tax=Lithohypha guttulata TaxID=1690604 RepID=A0ABR0K7B7_9EURO|nr:hypothetical protein LTR24_006106 [Lithohypha guttulata]KAK5317295.1 hypothetical protein LTR70_005912 [Exophiala xenobiotica]